MGLGMRWIGDRIYVYRRRQCRRALVFGWVEP